MMGYLGRIQPLSSRYQSWVEGILFADWEGWVQTVRGQVLDARALSGFVALGQGMRPEGFLLYHIQNHQCQVVVLDSRVERVGHGTALLNTVRQYAHGQGCRRLWLITNRENTTAIRFYQNYGLSIANYHAEGVQLSPRLQPSVHATGPNGMRLSREVEMSLVLYP